MFASANMEHPQALAAAGRAGPVRMFTRNRLCALVSPRLSVSGGTLLERMLDPAVKLGISTPKADPSGDYAWALFAKAEAVKPVRAPRWRRERCSSPADPNSPPPPKDRSVYGMLVESGQADIFLTYCTNAVVAQREVPALSIVSLPPELAVGADYGLTVMTGASPQAAGFAAFVMSPAGQNDPRSPRIRYYPVSLIQEITMKLSARNIFPGKVVDIKTRPDHCQCAHRDRPGRGDLVDHHRGFGGRSRPEGRRQGVGDHQVVRSHRRQGLTSMDRLRRRLLAAAGCLVALRRAAVAHRAAAPWPTAPAARCRCPNVRPACSPPARRPPSCSSPSRPMR